MFKMNLPLRIKKFNAGFGIYLLLTTQVVSQDYSPDINHISLRGRLSQNSVTAIAQDEQGFLWIGTQDGLNKYDGYGFKTFKSQSGRINSISNNYIRAIATDKARNLWLGTQIGLTRYNREKGSFQRFLMPNEEESNLSSVVTSLLVDANALWVGTQNGLYYASDFDRPKFDKIPNAFDVPLSIVEIDQDSNGNIWIATSDQLYCFTKNQKLLKMNWSLWNDLNSIKCIRVSDDILWVGATKGLWSIPIHDLEMKSIDQYMDIKEELVYEHGKPVGNFEVSSIYKDSQGLLWVGTHTEGLFTYQLSERTYNRVVARTEEDPLIFETTSIGEIFEDKMKNIWIGTVETGLFRIRRSGKKFGLLRSTPGQQNGLTSNRVRGLLKDGDSLWISTSKGLTLYDQEKDTFTVFRHISGDDKSLSSDDIKRVEKDNLGNIWVATNNGLDRITLSKQEIENFLFTNSPNDLIKGNKVRAVKLLSDGNLWVGTYGGGISVIDPKRTQLVKSFAFDPDNAFSISDSRVMDIFEDSNGVVWASTYGGGLNRLDKSDGRWNRISDSSNSSSKPFPLLLTTISEDAYGHLWVGSYGEGIARLDLSTFTYEVYTEEDGLSNNVTYASIPYGRELWISTNYGLSKYDYNTDEFTNYNVNDGLQSNEFNSGSYLLGPSGQMFFGGVNDLTFFYPDSIFSSRNKPDLVFTDFMIYNESVMPDEIIVSGSAPLASLVKDSSKVVLSHFHNVFSIEFAALDFFSPEDVNYAYRLKGFNNDWIFTNSNQRMVTYTNLKPGDYRFQFKATNHDGIWKSEPATLFIAVKPSLWETIWFRVVLTMLFIGVVSLVVYRRVNKVERRKRILESKVAEHTEEISKQNVELTKSANRLQMLNRRKDQMFYLLAHNVRAPLTTLISLLNLSKSNDLSVSRSDFNSYLNDLTDNVYESVLLLDNTFYWSKLQFGDLYVSENQFELSDAVEETLIKCGKMMHEKNIRVEKYLSSISLYGDQKLILVILHNLITNAIKYSYNDALVRIKTVHKSRSIQVVVEDEGIGMTEEEIANLFDEEHSISKLGTSKEKGTGLGLLLCHKLSVHLGYVLSAESDCKNTRFLLSIPL